MVLHDSRYLRPIKRRYSYGNGNTFSKAVGTGCPAPALVGRPIHHQRYIAGRLPPIPSEFEHVDYSWISGFTAAGVTGAVLTFGVIGRVARRPIRLFRTVSAVALVFSFVPDIALLMTKVMPGTNGLAVGLLMVLHVVAAVVSVGILTTLGRD